MKRPCLATLIVLLAGLAFSAGCAPKDDPVPPPPVAAFSVDVFTGLAPLQVQFQDESVSSRPITSWLWDFGDGNSATEQHPVHVYSAGGVYTVSLTVTSSAGSDTAVQPDRISVDFVTAEFQADVTAGAAPLSVQFTDQSTTSGTITAWAWNFGDGATSTTQNPSHVYGTDGSYTVSLAITADVGSDTRTRTDYVVVELLDADFTANPTSGTAPLQVQFTDATSASSTITGWSWTFGDGNTSTVQDPLHTYAAAGTFNVSLTVTTATGNDTETKNGFVTASAPPTGKPTNGSGGATGAQTGTYNGRAYRLWVPSTYSDANPSPIVVGMHGLGDTYTNFYNACVACGWQTAANTHNFILMVPNHTNSTRPSFLHFSGTNFDPNATVAEMNDLLNCIYYGVGANYNVETMEIYWFGFSEGGTFSDFAAYVLCRELHACAPYAGCISGKSFPRARQIPIYAVCGTNDGSYSVISSAFQEWVNAGHPTNNAWVSGVGHSFIGLCTSGPSPSAVYQWMSTVTCQPVVSGLP
ncbi:MAG: PKD domain-containing protein [Planctomycetota bacterium]